MNSYQPPGAWPESGLHPPPRGQTEPPQSSTEQYISPPRTQNKQHLLTPSRPAEDASAYLCRRRSVAADNGEMAPPRGKNSYGAHKPLNTIDRQTPFTAARTDHSFTRHDSFQSAKRQKGPDGQPRHQDGSSGSHRARTAARQSSPNERPSNSPDHKSDPRNGEDRRVEKALSRRELPQDSLRSASRLVSDPGFRQMDNMTNCRRSNTRSSFKEESVEPITRASHAEASNLDTRQSQSPAHSRTRRREGRRGETDPIEDDTPGTVESYHRRSGPKTPSRTSSLFQNVIRAIPQEHVKAVATDLPVSSSRSQSPKLGQIFKRDDAAPSSDADELAEGHEDSMSQFAETYKARKAVPPPGLVEEPRPSVIDSDDESETRAETNASILRTLQRPLPNQASGHGSAIKLKCALVGGASKYLLETKKSPLSCHSSSKVEDKREFYIGPQPKANRFRPSDFDHVIFNRHGPVDQGPDHQVLFLSKHRHAKGLPFLYLAFTDEEEKEKFRDTLSRDSLEGLTLSTAPRFVLHPADSFLRLIC